ncbi:TonB-dependent receptor [Saprospiraceae bacterium]|nr:TonB-dependent receptor [Saprospiraceae bacterium]
MKNLLITTIAILFSISLYAQPTQTVRGIVVDNESQYPLIGVNVVLTDQSGTQKGATTDLDGNFRIDNVLVGRASLVFSYLGYENHEIPDQIINSGKEVILDIKLAEAFEQLEDVVIVARKSGEVINDMAIVSAREFSVQETNRYAGSRGEPARMASNFAGVQGADDSRNDIIIRGNSPQGVLWRLDGINIPNPNHFSIPGTGGGPVTILNNKFLKNSDFFTGAFPAEYGNGIAGVFDLRMRNGNNEKHEFSAQLGFLGTELTAEGPLSKNSKASYLATYRYSTLQLFTFLGINVGTDAIPAYQDGAVRFNFPFKNGGNLSVFGIGGLSNIDIVLSENMVPDTSTLIFGSNDRDQYFGSRMGVVGATYTQPINENTFLKIGAAASHSRINANHNYLARRPEGETFVWASDSLPPILDYTFRENKYSAYAFVNKKINSRFSYKAGINIDAFDLKYIDSVRQVSFVNVEEPDPSDVSLSPWQVRWNAEDVNILAQPYVQFKYKASRKLTLTGGLTALYYSINNNSLSPFEPRLGLAYQIDNKQKLSLGVGIHSQIQSNYLYYYGDSNPDGTVNEYNKDMGLLRNNHIVLGYDLSLGKSMRLKAETYFQYLNNIPVDQVDQGFSIINSGSGFSRLFPNELENSGTGQNYGVELTLEKFFSSNYYFLVTTSIYDSKYRGADGVLRNTVFNGNYAVNALFAKEWKFKRSSLNIGGKVTTAGGRRYGEVDQVRTVAQQEIVYLTDDNLFEKKFRPYFRADAKVNYRFNTNKLTHEIAIDFVNIFNTRNILTLTYVPDETVDFQREEYQLGFLPLFYYRVDF